MLKREISKSEYEALPDDLKAVYVASKGKYSLEVEADPRVDTLTTELNAARKEVSDRKNFVDPSTIPNTDTLNTQLREEREGRASDVQKYQGLIGRSLIEAKASEIASKISKSPAIMKRFVSDNLTVDFSSENPVVKVRGADGNASDTSFDDLEKNLVANPDFSDIIIGVKAKGGATQTQPNRQSQSAEIKDTSSMSREELVAHMRAKIEASK